MELNFVENDVIIYFKAKGSSTELIAKDGDVHIIPQRLCQIEKKINCDNFCRCHRSFIVNTKQIKKVLQNKRQLNLVMKNDDEIQVAYRRNTFFKEFMGKNYYKLKKYQKF